MTRTADRHRAHLLVGAAVAVVAASAVAAVPLRAAGLDAPRRPPPSPATTATTPPPTRPPAASAATTSSANASLLALPPLPPLLPAPTTPPSSTTTTTSSSTTPSPVPAQLAIFDPVLASHADLSQLHATEQWQKKRHAVVSIYTNFDPSNIQPVFEQRLPQIWNDGHVPLLSWMPLVLYTGGVDQNAMIASGFVDGYLRQFAAAARTFLAGPDGVYGNADDRRLYLRFAHEMNGDWYPYSPAYANTPPSSFVAMWRHVHDVVSAAGLDRTRLAWVWSVNNVDSRQWAPAESLYPGDDYTDWVSIDGYDWEASGPSGSQTPDQVFAPMLNRLRALTSKPVAVDEVGAALLGSTVIAKSAWISSFYSWASTHGIRRVGWFNQASQWAVFGGFQGDEEFMWGGHVYLGYASYRTAVAAAWLLGPDASNARLMDDASFLGTG